MPATDPFLLRWLGAPVVLAWAVALQGVSSQGVYVTAAALVLAFAALCMGLMRIAVGPAWMVAGSVAVAGVVLMPRGAVVAAVFLIPLAGLGAIVLRQARERYGPWMAAAFAIGSAGAAGSGVILLDRPEFGIWIRPVATAGVAVMILGVRSPRIACGLAAALGMLVRILAILASPDPVIDVFHGTREAAAFQLAGKNPYSAQPYTDVYAKPRPGAPPLLIPPRMPPPFYPPHTFLAAMPAVAAGIDHRWIWLVADLLAGAWLIWPMRRGDVRAGVLLASAYWFRPNGVLTAEMSWNEPLMALLLGFALLVPGPGWRGGLAAGIGLTLKQFGAILLPVMLMDRRWRVAVAGGVGLAALVLVVPWLAADPASFWRVVVKAHLTKPPAYESLTLLSFTHGQGIPYPPPLGMMLAALGLVYLAIYRLPGLRNAPTGWLLAFPLLAQSLFGPQGHPNYYDLAGYLLLAGVAEACRPKLEQNGRSGDLRGDRGGGVLPGGARILPAGAAGSDSVADVSGR